MPLLLLSLSLSYDSKVRERVCVTLVMKACTAVNAYREVRPNLVRYLLDELRLQYVPSFLLHGEDDGVRSYRRRMSRPEVLVTDGKV